MNQNLTFWKTLILAICLNISFLLILVPLRRNLLLFLFFSFISFSYNLNRKLFYDIIINEILFVPIFIILGTLRRWIYWTMLICFKVFWICFYILCYEFGYLAFYSYLFFHCSFKCSLGCLIFIFMKPWQRNLSCEIHNWQILRYI